MYSYKHATVQQVGPIDTDTHFDSNNLSTVSTYPISMLFTVKHNKSYFINIKIEVENVAMDPPTRIGWTYPTKLKYIVNSGQLKK